MRTIPAVAVASVLALGLGFLVGRSCPASPCPAGNAPPGSSKPSPPAADHVRRLLEEAASREPFLAMRTEDETRAALASVRKFPQVPPLARVALLAPKTMDAEMAAWKTLESESSLDKQLVSDLFYVVSRGNECGYCLGHVLFEQAMKGTPREAVYALDDGESLDAKRTAVFTFARHMTACPPAVTRSDIDALRRHLNERQIVELSFFVCRFDTLNRLAEAWHVPLEGDFR